MAHLNQFNTVVRKERELKITFYEVLEMVNLVRDSSVHYKVLAENFTIRYGITSQSTVLYTECTNNSQVCNLATQLPDVHRLPSDGNWQRS